jgi:hypothetical protein
MQIRVIKHVRKVCGGRTRTRTDYRRQALYN